jgi:TP901 family phage tail tape measure protein
MSTRATIIIDANADPASREFRRLKAISGDAMRQMVAQTRAGTAATRALGSAWRRTGFEVALAMSKIDRSAAGIGRRTRRVTGTAGLVGGLGAIGVVSENRKFSAADLEIANILTGGRLNTPTGKAMARQRKSDLMAISRDPAVSASASDLAEVWAEMLAKVGEEAVGDVAVLRPVARAATGFRTDPREIGSLAASLLNVYGTSLEDLTASLEILAQAGKEGGVEMDNMAAKLGIVIPLARTFGFQGPEGLADIGALFQVANLQLNNPDMTTVAMRQFFNRFTAPAMSKLLGLAGIQRFDPATGRRRPARDILADIQAFTADDPGGFKLAALFPDIRGRQAASALFSNMERFEDISAKALAAQGQILEPDIASALESTAFKLDKAAANLATSTLELDGAVDTLSDVLLKASESPGTTAAVLGAASSGYILGPAVLGLAGTAIAAIVKREAIKQFLGRGLMPKGLLLGPVGVALTAADLLTPTPAARLTDQQKAERLDEMLRAGSIEPGVVAGAAPATREALRLIIENRAAVTITREDDGVPVESLVELE